MIVSSDTIRVMRPPFSITPKILTLVSKISLLLGRFEGYRVSIPQPKLRRKNRIKTIQGSLAIEGNELNLNQVTSIFDDKRVLGPGKDILEVQNAIRLYESKLRFNPNSARDLLKAHFILMENLSPDAGKFRSGSVGVLKGSKVSHIAPPAKRVPELIDDLIYFLKSEKDLSPLVKACVFHYELEFIHPFSDGNGRMGRFWQSLILSKAYPAFEYLPVESLIKQHQRDYYRALEQSDQSADSTFFIEFSLNIIKEALMEFLDQLRLETETPTSRLDAAKKKFRDHEFSRKTYIQLFKTISTATASRDLTLGVKAGELKKSGTKALTRYRFADPNQ